MSALALHLGCNTRQRMGRTCTDTGFALWSRTLPVYQMHNMYFGVFAYEPGASIYTLESYYIVRVSQPSFVHSAGWNSHRMLPGENTPSLQTGCFPTRRQHGKHDSAHCSRLCSCAPGTQPFNITCSGKLCRPRTVHVLASVVLASARQYGAPPAGRKGDETLQ